ncbi:hypothetical protein F2Q70_00030913 [Brassica cretica]|uniref:SLC26A/SulP transporter domain-containing protein n=1 Tax=Brassica cretica TaxID=69181 RepID=A0A8S9FEJ5_BRACR|nr:hypothetical protein F2Q70_00030913 [Brassica cretica]
MGLKGPEPVARVQAREGVAEVAEIVQQKAEIAELPQRSRSQLTIKEEEWKQKMTRYYNGALKVGMLEKEYLTSTNNVRLYIYYKPTDDTSKTVRVRLTHLPSGSVIQNIAMSSHPDLDNEDWVVAIKLGFIIDFLSKATLIGFMAGAAIIVSLQQLKALLGITHFTKQMGVVPVLSSVFHHTNEWSWQTIVMGVCFLLFLLGTRHLSMKKPKLFWVSAGAPLLSVISSTLLVFVFRADRHGISVIGKLQEGLNPPSWNMLQFHGSHLGLVAKTGLITGIVSLTVKFLNLSLISYALDCLLSLRVHNSAIFHGHSELLLTELKAERCPKPVEMKGKRKEGEMGG